MAVATKIQDPTEPLRDAFTGILRDVIAVYRGEDPDAAPSSEVKQSVWYKSVPENVDVGFPRSIYQIDNDRSQQLSNKEHAGVLSTITSAFWSRSPDVTSELGAIALPRLTDRTTDYNVSGWRVVWPDLLTQFDQDLSDEAPPLFGRVIRTEYQLAKS